MDITSAQYVVHPETGENEVIKAMIDGVESFVFMDPANRHYAAILEWAEKDGNTIQDAD